MPVLENARYEKFVQCLIAGMSQRKAYKEAFKQSGKWKDSTVDNKACKLFRESEIKARYEELQAETQDEAIMTRKKRMIRLSKIAQDEEKDANVQIKAIDTLNKMDGLYTNKVEMTANIDISSEDKRKVMEERLAELRTKASDDS